MSRYFLSRFKVEIERLGDRAEALIATEGRYDLRYVPFEYVNSRARLVFVGITPGSNQISLSYAALRAAFLAGKDDEEALAFAKDAAAFGGKQMRDRLNLMMRRFRVHELVGVADPEQVWDQRRGLLHSTSVVPHAAFKNGKIFNGPFSEVLKAPLLRDSFEQDFLPTLSKLPSSCWFVAIGPTPWDALTWCVENGHVGASQLLGAFAHPSGSAGSQVDYFVGRRSINEFTVGDPVLHRVPWLNRARAALDASVALILNEPAKAESIETTPRNTTAPLKLSVRPPTNDGFHGELYTVVQRGGGTGTILYPHKHKDGFYVVSPTRFKKDYIRVRVLEEVKDYIRRGYSVRMSNPSHASHRAPSLIAPGSVVGWTQMT